MTSSFAGLRVYELAELPRNVYEFDRLLDRFNDLLVQLSPKLKPVTAAYFRLLIERTPESHVYFAELDGTIVGMATRVDVRQPAGIKCWIEDVVVDVQYRKFGIAKAILRTIASETPHGAKHLNLTTSKGVGKVYEQSGYVRRDTQVYRLPLV
jgi:GNAT superfamily N-acetyltransferase